LGREPLAHDGGTLGDVKTGAGLKLIINATSITFMKDKSEITTIPASATPKSAMARTFTGAWEQRSDWQLSAWASAD
jgi:dihydroxyacid dehydratase/phosphogluconate dehydratase